MDELLSSCKEALPESAHLEAEWLINKAREKGWTSIRLWCYLEATLDDLYGVTPEGNLEQINHETLERQYVKPEAVIPLQPISKRGRPRSVYRKGVDPTLIVAKAKQHLAEYRKKKQLKEGRLTRRYVKRG